MLDEIVDSCRFLLNNFPEARACRDYLDSRINRESQELFQFGYFPNTQHIKALIDLVGEEALKNNELHHYSPISDSLSFRMKSENHFEHHPLIMPFRNPYGKIVGLVGRSLLSDEERKNHNVKSKYKNTLASEEFKKGNLLFGLYENKQHIIDQGCAFVVEGQFDVMKAMEKGFRNIVALGTSSMSFYQFSVISRYTNNIRLLLDNDEAGEKGRKLVINKFGKYANIQNFFLPESFKDIDEYLTQNGDEPVSFLVKG